MKQQTLVIRFSALGDVVLAGAVTGALGPVAFLTHPAWADVASVLPGVEQVYRWGLDDLPDQGWSRVIDLQGSRRSRLVCAAIRGNVSRLSRYTLQRRLHVALKTRPAPALVDRYATAARVALDGLPWIARSGPGPVDTLLLCPGAAHRTKQWPADRYAAVAGAWQGPVLVLGGPSDALLCRQVAGNRPDTGVLVRPGFTDILAHLHRGRACVAGDTGLMHLCAAAGIPTIGLYGPTTSRDGFWVHERGHSPGSRAVELDLPCRPCSRFGGAACPIGDHLCMTDLSVAAVSSALVNALM